MPPLLAVLSAARGLRRGARRPIELQLTRDAIDGPAQVHPQSVRITVPASNRIIDPVAACHAG